MVEPDRPHMTIRCTCFVCRITKATNITLRICNTYLLLFHGSNGHANMYQCHIIRTLPVLFLPLWLSFLCNSCPSYMGQTLYCCCSLRLAVSNPFHPAISVSQQCFSAIIQFHNPRSNCLLLISF